MLYRYEFLRFVASASLKKMKGKGERKSQQAGATERESSRSKEGRRGRAGPPESPATQPVGGSRELLPSVIQ